MSKSLSVMREGRKVDKIFLTNHEVSSGEWMRQYVEMQSVKEYVGHVVICGRYVDSES